MLLTVHQQIVLWPGIEPMTFSLASKHLYHGQETSCRLMSIVQARCHLDEDFSILAFQDCLVKDLGLVKVSFVHVRVEFHCIVIQ